MYIVVPKKFLKGLLDEFLDLGGKLLLGHKVVSLRDFALSSFTTDNFDVVINCTGLGAANILEDKEVVPIRGQIYSTPNKWVTTFQQIDDTKDYIIPK